MSNFVICSIAFITRLDLTRSLPPNNSRRAAGTICQDRPYLSFSQPHWPFSPPAERLLPEFVHFRLRPAVHHERHGLAELEDRAAVQRREFLSVEPEGNGHHRSLWSSGRLRPFVFIACDPQDFGMLEAGDVKFRRRFGLVLEPQEGSDFLHGAASVCYFWRGVQATRFFAR